MQQIHLNVFSAYYYMFVLKVQAVKMCMMNIDGEERIEENISEALIAFSIDPV